MVLDDLVVLLIINGHVVAFQRWNILCDPPADFGILLIFNQRRVGEQVKWVDIGPACIVESVTSDKCFIEVSHRVKSFLLHHLLSSFKVGGILDDQLVEEFIYYFTAKKVALQIVFNSAKLSLLLAICNRHKLTAYL